MSVELAFEDLVNVHYLALYRFAFSLTQSESDACDLTQQTFYIWATKGSQLLDRSKAKSWLFTTLHREFLQRRRKHLRFPEQELDDAHHELPVVSPEIDRCADAATVRHAVAQLPTIYHGPISLFYLDDFSYPEIAEILHLPVGTVKSRISRGIAQLQHLLADEVRVSRPAHE